MAHEEFDLKLQQMRQKIAIMQWDIDRQQMNPAKRMKFEKLKEEYNALKSQAESKEKQNEEEESKGKMLEMEQE